MREWETNILYPVLFPTTVVRRTQERERETNAINPVLTPTTVVRWTHESEWRPMS